MIVYLSALAFSLMFPAIGIALLYRLKIAPGRTDRATRPTDRTQQENAPTPRMQPQRGDFSAWQASSIEGDYRHVRI